MLTEELKDKLKETLAICDLHYQRMMFAWDSIRIHFPLTKSGLGNLTPIELALSDQLIYRFSKLQDSMGTRLFKQLLEALEEDISGMPFIDILNKMEQLNLLTDAKGWIALRQTRNTISHEYTFFTERQTEELNLLTDDVVKLASTWLKLKEYVIQRFFI